MDGRGGDGTVDDPVSKTGGACAPCGFESHPPHFSATCRRVGVRYTWNNWKTVSIARAGSVALLDTFVGPKT